MTKAEAAYNADVKNMRDTSDKLKAAIKKLSTTTELTFVENLYDLENPEALVTYIKTRWRPGEETTRDMVAARLRCIFHARHYTVTIGGHHVAVNRHYAEGCDRIVMITGNSPDWQ